MANKPSNQKTIRKLGKTGNALSPSYYITIPVELIKKFGWGDNQKLIVRKYKGKNKLVVEDWE